MTGNDDLAGIQARLAERWESRDVADLANSATRPLLDMPGEWDPPAGVEPERELLYLSIGIPDSSALPRSAIADAMQKVLARNDDAHLRYGFGQGHFPLREALSEQLRTERGMPIDPDWLQLANGSSGAIDLVVRSLIEPGDVIVAEAPAYMGTLHNFRGVQAEVRAVPLDEDGLCVDALPEIAAAIAAEGKRLRMIYTIATFQNPSGATLTLERRRQLLEFAAEHDCLILEDDAYADLWYENPPPDSLLGLSGGYGVINVGTSSKILATGLRIGWIVARPELLEMLRRMRFAMGSNQVAQRMLGEMYRAGEVAPHVAAMRALYHQKMQRLDAALGEYCGDFLDYRRPDGGFYFWPKLRHGLTSSEVWHAAYREGVSVNPGYGFYPDRQDPEQHLRIAFAWTPADQLEEAARRLGLALRSCAS